MTLTAGIMMIALLTIVWGGFFYFISKAFRKERSE
jgi:hypothetical protein